MNKDRGPKTKGRRPRAPEVFLVKLEPDKDQGSIAPPYSLLYLADALEKAGFGVRLFQERANAESVSRIVKETEAGRPLFVGFSNFTMSPLGEAQEASRQIKARTGIPVVWGGVQSTVFPRETLRDPAVDMVAVGEGEETVVELARALAARGRSGPRLEDVRGVGFKKDGRTVFTPPRPFIRNLDAYTPAWHHLDISRYIYRQRHFYSGIGSRLSGDRIFAMVTSRGCPWRCGYCYNQAVNRRTYRAHSPEHVLKQVKELKKLQISSLIFEDDNFFGNRARTMAIVRQLDLPWSCSIRADYIADWGEPFVRELAEHGCYELRIGAESGSQRILDLMEKDLTVAQIRRAVDLLAKYKIQSMLNFMLGIPGETWDDVRLTLDLIDELSAVDPCINVSSVAIYAPWPGGALSGLAERCGFKPPENVKDWAKLWAQRMPLQPYMDRRIKFIGFYRTLIRRDFKNVRFPFLGRALRSLAVARWRRRFFRFPVDYYLPAFVLRSLRKVGLGKAAGAIFD